MNGWGINPGKLTAADHEALGLEPVVSKSETTHSKMETVGVEINKVALDLLAGAIAAHDNSLSRKVVRSGCLECTTKERPKPYTRVSGIKGSRKKNLGKAGRAYYASQRKLGAYIRAEFMSDADVMAGESPFWDTPFLFALAIDVPVTAKGAIPKNAGDYDNYLKAWMDAAQMDHVKVFRDDSLNLYRGPCQIRPVPVMPSADGLWRFFWRVETI